MTRRHIAIFVAVIIPLVGGAFLIWKRPPAMHAYTRVSKPPAISPDYSGLMIPPNIAPLNFIVNEPGTAFRITISGEQGSPIELASRRPEVRIPLEQWRDLLAANVGGPVRCEVCVRDSAGQWQLFEPLVNTIAAEPIDGFLMYRYMDPVYRCWGHISIRQRDLTSFKERALISNRSFSYDCINCHSVAPGHSDRMALQLRSENLGPRLVVTHEGRAAAINTAGGVFKTPSSYLAWHPDGRRIAFAAIKVTQFFHALGETREVFDQASDLGIYLVDSATVVGVPAIARPDRLETYPNWSPDGRHLYFCSAPQLPIDRYKEVRYDLMRIAFDAATGECGEPEVLLAADQINASVTHPRVSPDGRFLMFCLCDYGNFSIYHPEAELYLLDLNTRQHRKLELNSDLADSYHSWSANSRWIVFSSKRRDGLLTHPYLSYIDAGGRAHKPFILPQQDARFYESSLKVFNVPELIPAPVNASAHLLAGAIADPAGAIQAADSGDAAATNADWHH